MAAKRSDRAFIVETLAKAGLEITQQPDGLDSHSRKR